MKINIVTSICVDKNKQDNSHYPQLKYRDSNQRRIIYWRCATVFLASSIRCNAKVKHILYTNDETPLILKGINTRDFLQELGVEIRYLPFEVFKTPLGLSKSFRNAFYKLDVIRAMGADKDTYSLLLDADCVWTKPNAFIFDLAKEDKLLVYDFYNNRDPAEKTANLSRLQMGEVYKLIDINYPQSAPIHYGGEIIGGSNTTLAWVADKMLLAYKEILRKFNTHPPVFANQKSFFDNDEYLSSYIYNTIPEKLLHAEGIIRRIETYLGSSKALPSDMNLTIWHLYVEKKMGFISLFKKVINKQSTFWKIPLVDFNCYLGSYLGVPSRNSKVKIAKLTLAKGVRSVMYILLHEAKKLRWR